MNVLRKVRHRIICIGSCFEQSDCAGFLVYQRLAGVVFLDDVEVIDGGLGGLSLLPLFERCDRLLLIDAVEGFAAAGRCVLIELDELVSLADAADGHQAGLPYLVRAAQLVCEPFPELTTMGIESPWTMQSIERAAELAEHWAEGSLLCGPSKAERGLPVAKRPSTFPWR